MSAGRGPSQNLLCAEFLPHLESSGLSVEGLEAALNKAWDAARAAWPTLLPAREVFLRHLAQRLPVPPARGLAAEVDQLRAPDLYVACGCAEGWPAALKALEDCFLSRLPPSLKSLDPSPSFADDVQQRLREKLLMSKGGRGPAIQDYSGRGPLQTWLRSAAVRIALNLRAAERPHQTLEDHAFLELAGPSPGPELALLRERIRPVFARAFQGALQSLTAEQRNLMRLHLLDGLGIDALAPLFGSHRSTVARWIVRNREQIADQTRRALESELKLGRKDLDELMSLVRSQLDVSLQRFLRTS